jgi:plastocyanin
MDKRFMPVLLAVLATSAGCGDGDGGTDPDQPVLTTVEVTPATSTLFNLPPGNTVELAASPKDQNGDVMTGLDAATFTSASEAVATVADDGTVTAAGAGSTEITAAMTDGDVIQTGSATVVVEAAPATAAVGASGLAFSPATVDVSAGGTVTWTFGEIPHDVTFSTPGAPQNVPLLQNGSASRDFAENGTFQYRCSIHAGMNGTVRVH